jgi:ketosteroid isomerase-like protein
VAQDNVRILKDAFEHLARTGEPALHLVTEDHVLENIDEAPITDPYVGHQGLRRWFADQRDVIEPFAFELLEVVAVGDDVVVSTQVIRGQTPTGGAELEFPFFGVWWFRDGKIFRTKGFTQREDALAAAGLTADVRE